jgi:protein disulfide-isomerase
MPAPSSLVFEHSSHANADGFAMLRPLGLGGLSVVMLAGLVQAGPVEQGVNWRTNLEQAKLEAAQSKRLVLVHFMTRTCGPCKYLDQNVFSLPQVGAAIEQDFVPVRIDADASPALQAMFRVDKVPNEFIMTPEGNVLYNPPIPDKADAYVAQLQGIARHLKQQAAAASPATTQQATVNPAYAGLPVSGAAAGAAAATMPGAASNPATSAAQGAAIGSAMAGLPNLGGAAPPTNATTPQAQANPFVSTNSSNRYGQAQSVYAPATQQPPAAQQNVASSTATIAAAAQNPPATATTPAANATTPASASAAAAASVAVSKPEAPNLPAGSPPLAFDGYCPVTLKTLNRWTPGNVQFGMVHRGRTYLFAGAEQRDQFLANPDSYSPVFSGLDPVLLIDNQQAVDGSRAFGFRYGDAFYLFSSKETMEKFRKEPHMYAAGVRQAMNRLDASNGGTLRR